jgi:HlyD family secretion protein
MKSKKLIIGIIVVAVVAAAAFAALTLPRMFAKPVEAGVTPVAQPSVRAAVAEGKLVPSLNASLSLPLSGRVAEVLVKEGEAIQAGQVLLHLEDARQRATVAQAEAALAGAQARLAQLKAGALPAEVITAQSAVDAAQARLDRLASQDDVRGAEAALASSQAALAKLREGTSADQLIAARADLANALAARSQAQAAYDRVQGNVDIGARPESSALQQATNNYNAAAARVADLEKGASKADIAGAQARVNQAQAQVDALKSARPSDLAGAEAELRQAQAQLQLTTEGSRPEIIAAAEADVAAAQAGLDQARAALAETELHAPFAGVVADLATVAGEQVAPGAPVVQVADFAHWHVETTDLTELNVVRVKEGDRATITFDALPGETFDGVVEGIKTIGENYRGDISYTAIVRPERTDPRLRWNMTAAVEFGK